MTGQPNTPLKRKPESEMLKSFKANANPYYSENFGLALNNVNFWQKNIELQYIVVWAGGGQFTFLGDDARSVLYNLGDRDSIKFRTLTPEEKQRVWRVINGEQPQEPIQAPVESAEVITESAA